MGWLTGRPAVRTVAAERNGQWVGIGDGTLLRLIVWNVVPAFVGLDSITVIVRICYAYGDLSSSLLTSPCEHASH